MSWEQADCDWLDTTRDRTVPVKVYYPATGEGPWPVMIHSHGLGGSRDGYGYLGHYWARHGYVVVHVQHQGSDVAVWKGKQNPMEAMRRAAADPQAAIDRVHDVRFVIDQLEKLNRGDFRSLPDGACWPLAGQLDLARIGMSGHSFGAHTALAIAGQVFLPDKYRDLASPDPRVKAAVAMSPPAPRHKDRLDEQFGGIAIPCLHLTGTRDTSPVHSITAEDRRLPFRHIRKADQYLVVLNGGDHMVFAGRKRFIGAEMDPIFHRLIQSISTTFWDAYLRGDVRAKSWLAEGGLEEALDDHGTAEKTLV